jgi:hypothetical protein
VAAAEGRPWTAVGLLLAAGALKSALQLLRQVGGHAEGSRFWELFIASNPCHC